MVGLGSGIWSAFNTNCSSQGCPDSAIEHLEEASWGRNVLLGDVLPPACSEAAKRGALISATPSASNRVGPRRAPRRATSSPRLTGLLLPQLVYRSHESRSCPSQPGIYIFFFLEELTWQPSPWKNAKLTTFGACVACFYRKHWM